MITLIDYGAGNLFSVRQSLRTLGYGSAVAQSPDGLENASLLILPGVGAFGDGMRALEKSGFAAPVKEWIQAGKPFLGICLGMQFLFEQSREIGVHKGLGLLPGEVGPIPSGLYRVPHMGWNSIAGTDRIIFEPGCTEAYVYFVHSYFRTTDGLPEENLAAVCEYTRPFAAAVRVQNAYGLQFHPEKSGDTGLEILRRLVIPK